MAENSIRSKEEIFDLIRRTALEMYPDAAWSGLRTGSFEWLLAQIVAEVSNLNGLYGDLRANEAYISSATFRKDIRDICSNLGLFPRERSGATVELTFTATDSVTIPKGTRVGTDNGEIFATLNELVLVSPSPLSSDVLAVNADYTQVSYRARGDAGEVIALLKNDILVDHLTVTVNGTEWAKVDNLLGVGSLSEVYLITFDESNKVSIKFGDGTYGKRLPADASILVDVFFGGGPAGNAVSEDAITNLLDSFSNSGNVSDITNDEVPTGGRGAESIDSIRAQIPSQLRQISGLVNPEDLSKVIKANLSWVGDATAQAKHTTINSTFVPVMNVIAYPTASTITGMSVAQSSELATFLANRGELGVSWTTEDAYSAPIELELEVKLANRNLALQKEAEIKSALNGNILSPFFFDNLAFDNEYTEQLILDTVLGVSGVTQAKINRFNKIPQTLIKTGADTADAAFADLSLGEEAEDGYFEFVVSGTTTAASHFLRPVKVDTIGNSFVRSSEVNWLVEEYEFASGAEFNDIDGPYVTTSASKLVFKQLDTVWETDQFNGSGYLNKHLLKLQWVDTNTNLTYTAYYHIASTTTPGLITTLENANTPISGTGISATLASADYVNIKLQIIKDQSAGSTNSLLTPVGNQLTITHNDANSLFLTTDPSSLVPINQHSFIHFNETALSTAQDNWIAASGALKARLNVTNTLNTGDIIDIYTTPIKANKLNFKAKKEVFVLNSDNITIRFV